MNDRRLLERVRTGDERAFAELFDRHARPVLAFARSRLGDRAEADDVTQAAFVLRWEKRREFEPAGESVLPWLLGTARLLALAAQRTAARRGLSLTDRSEPVDARPDPERAAELAERQRVVAAAVAALSDIDREVYRLCFDEGSGYAEVAAEAARPHGAWLQ